MAPSNGRRAALVVEMAFVLAVAMSCGGSTPVARPAPDQITGAASCPSAESQDLTFSGALTGHITCSTAPAKCSMVASTPSLAVPVNATIGSSSALLLVVFRFFLAGLKQDQTGTYAAGRLGDEPDSSLYGVSLDGFGHWETPTPGGSITLSTDGPTGASGTLDVKLSMADKTITVSGSWRCVRP